MSSLRNKPIIITEIDLCAWLSQAAPQDALEYHRGFLVLDTDPRISRLAKSDRLELVQVAQPGRWAAEKQLVHLVQRRLGESRFSYLAIARPRPETPALVFDAVRGGRVMQTDRSNRPRLEDLSAMPVGDITKLPADQLALLQDDATAALEAAKRIKDWLDGAIALRYAEQAAGLRQQQGKDTGTVRFEDGDVTVVAELPKKVEWDQVALGQLVERIKARRR